MHHRQSLIKGKIALGAVDTERFSFELAVVRSAFLMMGREWEVSIPFPLKILRAKKGDKDEAR